MLNVDPASTPGEISDKFFKRRRILKWIAGQQREQFLRFGFEAAGRSFLASLSACLAENDSPSHHSSS